MAESVSWAYDGSTLVATVTGATIGQDYHLFDGFGNLATVTAVSSTVVLTQADAVWDGDPDDPSRVAPSIYRGSGSTHKIGITVVESGVAGEASFPISWSFDAGTGKVSAAIVSTLGVNYMFNLEGTSGDYDSPIAATGTLQTLVSVTGSIDLTPSFVRLYNYDSSVVLATRMFSAGVSGVGSLGNPVSALPAVFALTPAVATASTLAAPAATASSPGTPAAGSSSLGVPAPGSSSLAVPAPGSLTLTPV